MFLPRALWVTLNKRYGINLYNLVDAAVKYESLDSFADKEKILVYLCKNLLRSIKFNECRNSNQLDKASFQSSHKEIDRLLSMRPNESLKESNKYNENLLRIISSTKNHDSNVREYRKPMQSTPIDDDAGSFEIERIININKATDNILKASGRQQRLNNKNHSKASLTKQSRRERTFKSTENNSDTTYEPFYSTPSPADLLNSRMLNLSKNNVLNVLSTGYEINASQLNAHNTSQSLNTTSDFMPDMTKNYLSILYIVVKFFYLTSLIGQVFFLNRLIGNDFYMLGINLVKSFLDDKDWPHLAVFPRVTLCEIYIREVGIVHPYLIQCVLRINLFNEVIFILVWFWLLLLLGITGFDFVTRVFFLLLGCSSCKRKLFALKYLKLINMGSFSFRGDQVKNIFNKEISDDLKSMQTDNKCKLDKVYKPLRGHKTLDRPDTYYDNNVDEEYTSDRNETHLLSGSDPEQVAASTNLEEIHILVKLNERDEMAIFEKFCSTTFSNDTIFALRLVQQNASPLIIGEIIEYLWMQFKCLNFIVSDRENDFILKKLTILANSTKTKPKNGKQGVHFALIEMNDSSPPAAAADKTLNKSTRKSRRSKAM